MLPQAITRTNRPFTNREPGQEKTAGLVIDYIGLGAEIAKAVQVKRKEQREKIGVDDVATLHRRRRDQVRFSGWQASREGDRTVKFEIRKAFK